MKHITVIGAGALGGWTALKLREQGFRVTLIEARSAGNSLSSSGDETRVSRTAYANDAIYSAWAHQGMAMWEAYQKIFKTKIFYRQGVLYFMGQEDAHWRMAKPILEQLGVAFTELSVQEAAKRYPHICFDGIQYAVLENNAGYLLARTACQLVKEYFVQKGGTYLQAAVTSIRIQNNDLQYITLSNGSIYKSDAYVFACGAWLGKIFPDVIGELIRPTKQEVCYFAIPPGSDILQKTPIWLDYASIETDTMMYGIPASASDAAGRGFKIAEHTLGADIEPDTEDRFISKEQFQKIKTYMNFRFPSMRQQPVAETRVCQYENTPDAHLIIDKHPFADNAWLLGGGSGHGYKHAPIIGELMANRLQQKQDLPTMFRLSRFKTEFEKVSRR